MKKTLAYISILTLIISIFVGCTSNTSSKKDNDVVTPIVPTSINIGCMKGPTAIGMIKLLSDSKGDKTSNIYNYTIAGTADEISSGLIKGSLDIAAVPCNLASVLYNKTEGEIVTVAINTLGVLYIVEAGDSVQTVADLKGKTIYSTGQGTTPEYTLRYLLTNSGIDPDNDVTIEYKSEAPEVLAALTNDSSAIAMLPQPYTTVALKSNENFRIALDVSREWESICNHPVVTGVLVARKSFIENNNDAFAAFMSEYKTSTEFANSNVDETANLLEEFDVFKAAIAKSAIPNCNVTYIDGEDMVTTASNYLTILFEQNPKSVGGKFDKEMFYESK